MFMDILTSKDWKSITPISKGWSSDKKYLVETANGEFQLLRISDIEEYETKNSSNIVRKVFRVMPHCILYHAIQFLYDKLHDILESIGHFRCTPDLSVRSDRKRQKKQHD